MKWYPRDPAAAIEGMLGLTPEERGYYNLLIDLLYARDGKGVTDALVSQAMGRRPQEWRRVKERLITCGKVREADGLLMANRVETTLETASKLIRNQGVKGRVSALKRAEIKHLVDGVLQHPVTENQNHIESSSSSFFLTAEAKAKKSKSKPNGSAGALATALPTGALARQPSDVASRSLEEIVKAKGWVK